MASHRQFWLFLVLRLKPTTDYRCLCTFTKTALVTLGTVFSPNFSSPGQSELAPDEQEMAHFCQGTGIIAQAKATDMAVNSFIFTPPRPFSVPNL